MAKTSGLGDNLYVGGYNLSGDIGSIGEISCPQATQDVTGIDKSGHERIGLLRDGKISFTAFFNPSSNQAHPVLSALPTADVVVTYLRGTAIGNAAAAMVAKQLNYDFKRSADSSLTIDTDAQANGYGLEWGVQLTAGIRTDTAASNGTIAVDTGAELSFGMQAYLQVFSFTGTDATIVVREASDEAFSTGLQTNVSFTVTSAPFTQRLTTTNTTTIRRYLKANTTTTGGFTNLRFAVVVVKNSVAGVTF